MIVTTMAGSALSLGGVWDSQSSPVHAKFPTTHGRSAADEPHADTAQTAASESTWPLAGSAHRPPPFPGPWHVGRYVVRSDTHEADSPPMIVRNGYFI